MKNLAIVVAMATSRLIGVNGKIPWHLPSDLAYFRELTIGHPVIMGRKTYESLPEKFRPLPGRANIVLSRDPIFDQTKNITICKSWEEARELVTNCMISFVIGGAEIYNLALPDANTIYQTVIHAHFDGMNPGNVFFPVIPRDKWEIVSCSNRIKFAGEKYRYVRKVFRRR